MGMGRIDFNTPEMSELAINMPVFHFPKRWGVKILPPFLDAIIRFVVHYFGFNVTVNLAYEDAGVGFFADKKDIPPPLSPVFEIFPYFINEKGGSDSFKIGFKEVVNKPSLLISLIQAAFNNQYAYYLTLPVNKRPHEIHAHHEWENE
jgi:hypothetical protein